MHLLRTIGIASCIVVFANVAMVRAGGIIPDRINQIIIEGDFADETQGFLAIFSSEPLRDRRGRLVTIATTESLASFKNTKEKLALKLHGKKASRGKRFDYFFGTRYDADEPWNNGKEFRWQDWEKYSPDIGDNLCIVALPPAGFQKSAPTAVVRNVTIRRNGQMLYDSRKTKSYPNKQPIKVKLEPFSLTPRKDRYPVLNLAEQVKNFQNHFYELHNEPILRLAYSDLGQTEKRKYANRGNNWCTEFNAFVYRENGVMTPNPNAGDVHWKNFRAYFEKHGKIYTAREVAGWSNRKKIATIRPGAFVSILIGDSTHSLFFTGWVIDGRQPITRYVAVSGNNRSVVYAHAPVKLPTEQSLKGKSAKELEEFDQKVYFAVPAKVRR